MHLKEELEVAVRKDIQIAQQKGETDSDKAYQAAGHVDLDNYRRIWREEVAKTVAAKAAAAAAKPAESTK